MGEWKKQLVLCMFEYPQTYAGRSYMVPDGVMIELEFPDQLIPKFREAMIDKFARDPRAPRLSDIRLTAYLPQRGTLH